MHRVHGVEGQRQQTPSQDVVIWSVSSVGVNAGPRSSARLRVCLLAFCLLLCSADLGGVAYADEPASSPTTDPLTEAQQLLASGKYQDALLLAEKCCVDEKNQPKSLQAFLLKGRCLSAIGQDDKALIVFQDLLKIAPDEMRLDLYQAVAEILLKSGDFAKAEATISKAGAIYARTQQATLRAAGAAQYALNRLEYEGAVKYTRDQLSRVAQGYEKRGNLHQALETYAQLYCSYPEYPGSRLLALKIAQLSQALKDNGTAAAYYVEVLTTGSDRVFSGTALLTENQWYLDEAATPPAEDVIHQALTGLNGCCIALPGATILDEPALGRLESAWSEALGATFSPSPDAAQKRWAQLARRFPTQPWVTLSKLALLEQWLRDGSYREAAAGSEKGASDAVPEEARSRTMRCAGTGRLALGRFVEAREALNKVTQQRTEVSEIRRELQNLHAGDALCRLAEGAEQRGRLAEAEQYYRLAMMRTPSLWQRRTSDYALQRLAQLKALPSGWGRVVSMLPDDRTTRGNWPLGYGRESYILCAQNTVLDRVGGALPALTYRFSTTNPQEPSRLWVSQKSEADPAALWDPFNRVNRSANRDDCGEQVELGKGPDLLLNIDVPPGPHLLSLYFVNDHNYYEPRREYAISVTDQHDVLQTVTHVRDFGAGVYKRFAVSGPQSLRIHIWRNLSLNVLLSGVFLDPVQQLSPCPLSGGSRTRAIAQQFAELANTTKAHPFEMACRPERLTSLIDALEELRHPLGVTKPEDRSEQAAIRWMLSECYGAVGYPVRGALVFDEYLQDIGSTQNLPEALASYSAVADSLLKNLKGEPLAQEQVRRSLYRTGEHPWDRLGMATIDSITSPGMGSAKDRETQLRRIVLSQSPVVTSYVKSQAFRALQADFPKAASETRVLVAAADANRAEADLAGALALYRLVLDDKSQDGQRPSALYSVLGLQADLKCPPEQAQQTYDELVRCGDAPMYRSLVRAGLLDLARCYTLTGDAKTAGELLQAYEQKYGQDTLSMAFRSTHRL